jgi:saposin
MINKALILCLIVATGTALKLGSDRCTWGPSYWCKGVETAQECNTEEHCRAKVWVGNHPLAKLTSPLPNDNDIPASASDGRPTASGSSCAVCELIGQEIFKKMKENATEAEFLDELDSLCEYTPASTVASCKSFVDEYGKEFYEAFIENASVHDLCTYLGLCSQEFKVIMTKGRVFAALLSQDLSSVSCDSCQALMSLIQKEALSNEKYIEGLLDEICVSIPVDQDECSSTINGMFEAFISIMESYTPTELCQMVGMCSDLAEQLLGVAPVKFGQLGQTGPAARSNLGTDDSCENGPSYWCSSEETAVQCEAVEFCKSNGTPIVF